MSGSKWYNRPDHGLTWEEKTERRLQYAKEQVKRLTREVEILKAEEERLAALIRFQLRCKKPRGEKDG